MVPVTKVRIALNLQNYYVDKTKWRAALTCTKNIVCLKSSCPYHKKGIQSYMKLKFPNYSYDTRSYTKAIRVELPPYLLPQFKLPGYYFFDDFERQSGS